MWTVPLTEFQQEYLRNCSHRWNVKTGATRSGKTYLDCAVTMPKRICAARGEGLLVLEAAELLRAGRSFEEVGDRILARRPHMCQFFTVDDLNYLKRGGRISGAAALVGSVLGIKPILRGDETGHIVSCGKVRGNKKAYAELADYFDKRALDKTARIGIAHADNCEGTDYLLGLLRERGFTGECLEVYYEPVTGAHVGPGTVALFFYGTEK